MASSPFRRTLARVATCRAVDVDGSAVGGVLPRERLHRGRQPYAQVERVKVADVEPDVLDVASLRAALLERVHVKLEVSHVAVLLQAEDCADTLLRQPA